MEKNETNTETIFENFISKYADSVALGAAQYDWIYERQASKNDKIKKMLVCASKKDGSGKDYPDFIIQSRKNSDFIIVVDGTPKHNMETDYSNLTIDDFAPANIDTTDWKFDREGANER